jgi:hypothetical protein
LRIAPNLLLGVSCSGPVGIWEPSGAM